MGPLSPPEVSALASLSLDLGGTPSCARMWSGPLPAIGAKIVGDSGRG
jgi:hypothetical protein